MPELPEVETMVRGIRPRVEKGVIRSVEACECAFRPICIRPSVGRIQRRVTGRRVQSVRRLAKRVVLALDSGDAFVIEPRMTGLMLIADPPDEEHLRVRWDVAFGRKRQRLWFWDRRGLGTVKLLNQDELSDLENGGRLGPDPIGLPRDEWYRLVKGVRRPVKVALLDQRLFAGIGNLYASEILHVAGVHPAHRTDRLTRRQIDSIRQATDEVLLDAIEHEGSTLSDGTYRNVLNQDGSYQNAHRVYDRADELCRTCSGGTIRRIVQAQRSTFFCPACQSRSRRSSPSVVVSAARRSGR